jgi:hypothetical protein
MIGIAEFILQAIWEGAVEVAYHKWGWLGGLIAFLLPILFVMGGVWLLVR